MRKRSWTKNPPIPPEIICPIISRMHREKGYCCDNFIQYEWEQVREQCGPEYAGVPLDDVKRYGQNLRKASKLEPVNGHGATKMPELSQDYHEALKRPEFREIFAVVKALYDNRCAVCYCYGKLEPHHRTYERLGNELASDIIPVCRKCHKVCDVRRQRQMANGLGKPETLLFSP